MSACTTAPSAANPDAVNDPYEGFNRKMFAFNMSLDTHVMRPVAVFYHRALPKPARTGVHNFLANLDMPQTIANNLLQAKPKRFVQAVGRVVVNSSLGIAGFVDVATRLGIPNETADLGQTLGIYGVGDGPYLVLPFVGPDPPREIAGGIGDQFLDPFTYVPLREKGYWMGARTVLDLIDSRERDLDTVDRLKASSIDFYATVRNLYLQDREAKIRGHKATLDDLPDY